MIQELPLNEQKDDAIITVTHTGDDIVYINIEARDLGIVGCYGLR